MADPASVPLKDLSKQDQDVVKRIQGRLREHQERHNYIKQRQGELRHAESEVAGLHGLLEKSPTPDKIVIVKAGCQIEWNGSQREEVLAVLEAEMDLMKDQIEAMDEQSKKQMDAALECQAEVQEILEAHLGKEAPEAE